MKNQTIQPKPTDATPSMMKSHRQPWIPCAPSRFSVMAPASRPERAPAIETAV